MYDLPQPVSELVDVLAAMPVAVAVVLGGSHALGNNDTASDWDLGLYYRDTIAKWLSLVQPGDCLSGSALRIWTKLVLVMRHCGNVSRNLFGPPSLPISQV